MVEPGGSRPAEGGAGRLLEGARTVDRAGGAERRHETLMERAERWGLERSAAEGVYALAEEEGLEPELALLLAASGVGVRELDQNAADPAEPGRQQAPPAWVARADVAPEEAQRERRLRLSFRRLNSLLGASGSAAAAAERFLGEPDVVENAY